MNSHVISSSRISGAYVRTDAVFPVVLAALFVLVYTQGYIERIVVSSHVLKMTIEVPVLIIMLHLINRGFLQIPPGSFLITLYVIWTVVSAVYQGDGMQGAILYCRYVAYAYIVFFAVWVTPLTGTAVTRINAVIASLFVFQILASVYEVFIRGERIEAHVGALLASGGSLATEFPLFAMGLTVPFYLYYRRNPLLLLLSWAFFFVGYASGKRAIYFLGPFLYVFILGWYVLRVRSAHALMQSAKGIVAFICLIPLLLLGVSRSHGISHSNWRGPLEQVNYALDAATQYTTAQSQTGRTMGRTATSWRVLATLWSDDTETVIFGSGPLAVRYGGTERYERLMISYGMCGWAQDVICVGWPAMLIYVLFQLRMFLCLRSCAPPSYGGYWMAIRFGAEIGFLVIMLSYIGYSSSVITGGHLSYVYFYLLALLTSPVHQRLRATSCGSVHVG